MSTTVVPPPDEVSCFFSPPPKRFPIPSAVFGRLSPLVGNCFVKQSAGGAALKALVPKGNSDTVSSTAIENSDGPVMIYYKNDYPCTRHHTVRRTCHVSTTVNYCQHVGPRVKRSPLGTSYS